MIIEFENFPIYSVCFLLSLTINCVLFFVLGKIQKIDRNTLLCSLTIECLGIICGSKILNMIQVKENNSFYYAGFSAYGGVIGGIGSLILFSKVYNVSLKKILNIYILLLPLLYSVSKLGCFFNGCCYGIEYDGFGSVIYKNSGDAPNNISLFPVQLVESVINFAIFGLIMLKYKNNKDSIKIVSRVFILCGICKFVLEFFRASWGGIISSTQFISLVFIGIGFIIEFNWRKDER